MKLRRNHLESAFSGLRPIPSNSGTRWVSAMRNSNSVSPLHASALTFHFSRFTSPLFPHLVSVSPCPRVARSRCHASPCLSPSVLCFLPSALLPRPPAPRLFFEGSGSQASVRPPSGPLTLGSPSGSCGSPERCKALLPLRAQEILRQTALLTFLSASLISDYSNRLHPQFLNAPCLHGTHAGPSIHQGKSRCRCRDRLPGLLQPICEGARNLDQDGNALPWHTKPRRERCGGTDCPFARLCRSRKQKQEYGYNTYNATSPFTASGR